MIRVVLVDDQTIVRTGLARILAPDDGFEVVAECGHGEEALATVPQIPADVVLMDIRMPRVDGLAATELLRARLDPPEIIVLTTFDASVATVKQHVSRILTKLDLNNRTQIALLAHDAGPRRWP